MTVDDLWALCETQRKKGQGFMPVRIFKKDTVSGVGWGPFAVGAAFVDPGDGTVTLYATEPCPTCHKP